MKLCKNLKGGLQEVADQLELRRVGPQHQAGSDSHLTGMAFFKIKEVSCIFNLIPLFQSDINKIKHQLFCGFIKSFMSCMVYLILKNVFQIFFDDNIESSSGHLYGLGAPFSVNVNNFQDNGENGNSS